MCILKMWQFFYGHWKINFTYICISLLLRTIGQNEIETEAKEKKKTRKKKLWQRIALKLRLWLPFIIVSVFASIKYNCRIELLLLLLPSPRCLCYIFYAIRFILFPFWIISNFDLLSARIALNQ